MSSGHLPLTGVRVLELGQYIAAPGAGMLLAAFGADVIKVEPLHGEPLRVYRTPTLFSTLNRNKSSLSIDLKHPEGVELYHKLAETADVVVDNLLAETVDRLGVGYDALAARNPRLIYCGIRGFLPGPRANRPMYDGVAQILSGVAYMTGPPGRPLPAGVPIVDLTAGVWSVLGILAALRTRDSTGLGQRLDVGLFETAVYWTAIEVGQASVTGKLPPPTAIREEGGRPNSGIYRLFTTRDGRTFLIQVVSDQQWERFCAEFGFDDLWQQVDLRTRSGRSPRYLELEGRLEAAVADLMADELTERLERAQVPHARVGTPLDIAQDDALLETGSIVALPFATGQDGMFRAPGIPLRGSSGPLAEPVPAPAIGGQTRALLAELGLPAAEIDRLLAANVVRQPA